jgi:hypothetical protein
VVRQVYPVIRDNTQPHSSVTLRMRLVRSVLQCGSERKIVHCKGNRARPLPWFHLLQHVNAKRDWIYCKTRQWKYYWLQNATRYVISKWCFLPCYQESISDCKTRFDSFGRILGAGVPFSYISNVKAKSGSLRNLPFKVEPCTSPIFLVSIRE